MPMRWSMELLSPSLAADAGTKVALGPDAEGRTAEVAVSVRDQMVELAADAVGPAGGAGPEHPEWHLRAHLAVLLNPGHDHATQWLYGVDDGGAVTAAAHWVAPGEQPGDGPAVPLDDPPAGRGRFETLGDGRFRVRLALPAKAIWPDGATVAGLMVKVGFHERRVVAPLQWPAPAWDRDVPLFFGDLHRAAPPLRVDNIDVPRPAWQEPTTLTIRATRAPDAPDTGVISAQAILPGDCEQPQPQVPWRADGQRVEVHLPVVFGHRGSFCE